MHKDVRLFTQTAADLDVPAPVCAATSQLLALARSQGLGKLDMTVVMRLCAQLADAQDGGGTGDACA